MLFRREFLEGIRDGRVTLAFRRWQRPTVRSGGTLLTALGQLSIASVESTTLARISPQDAQRAGYPSLEALRAELERHTEGTLYRIELGPLRADPRVALRARVADDASALDALVARLARMDARAKSGAWTRRTLELIGAEPGTRAGDLCGAVGQPRDVFKRNVRRLKGLGLTESLEVGYRLSPRGRAVLARLRARS